MTDALLTESPADSSERSAESRRWIRLLAVAATALVTGAVASTSVLLLGGYRYVPERKFKVTVTLVAEAGTEQKAAIRSELADLAADGEVRFETREEALARFKKSWKDDPERIAGVQAESMSEAFHVSTVEREFDCTGIPAIRELAGVERLWVVMRPTGTRPGAEVAC